MPVMVQPEQDQFTTATRVGCTVLGGAMIAWGIAPAFIYRVATGDAPSSQMLAMGSFSVLVGFTFVGLSVLLCRYVRWALWATFWLSSTLAVATLMVWMVYGPVMVSQFVLILGGGTAASAGVALLTERPKPPAEE